MRFLLGLARTLVALGLGVWIGGLAFFGAITAAIMFPMTKKAGVPALAPQMVGPMLSRFAIVCVVCSVLIIAGWLIDGALSKRGLWWRIQGALTLVAVALGTYLNFGLLPAVERDIDAVLPLYMRSLSPSPHFTPAETELKTRFDTGHQKFGDLARINIWLLVGVLSCLMAHSLPPQPERQS
jgi:hypothetical protein